MSKDLIHRWVTGAKTPWRTASSVLIGLATSAGAAQASPADLFGVGLRPQGMVQTGIANGDHDHQSAANPALLGGRTQQHLSLGYQSAVFESSYSGSSEGQSQDAVNATTLGVTLPLPFGGVLENRLAIGFSAYSPRKLVTRAQIWYADTPQFPLLASRAQSLSLASGLGVLLHERLRLGVGVQWLASLVGSVAVTGSDEGETTTVVEDELVTSLAPVLGASVEPADDWHVGLVWRDEHTSEVDLKIQVAELGALELPELNIAGMAQYDPEQVDAELQWTPDAWSLVLGVRYRRWSAFPGFLAPTFVCPSDEPVCGTQAPAAPDFSDTWTPKAALALRFALGEGASAEVRSGVAYEPTPMPEQTGAANRWDNARVVASAGYGVDFDWGGVPLSLELAFQQHWMRERTHVKSSDVAAGDSEPNLSRVVTQGQVRLFALAAGVEF